MKKGLKIAVIILTIVGLLVAFSHFFIIPIKSNEHTNLKTYIKKYGTEDYIVEDLSNKSWNNYKLIRSVCENGTTIVWNEETKTLELSTNKTDKCKLYFEEITNIDDVLIEETDTPDFTKTSCQNNCDENTVGVYEYEDDYGISHYYRGNVDNNYVRFGKNKDNNDMYWRIIRINGDGSLRLIYDGTMPHKNGDTSEDRIAVKDVKWADIDTIDNKYVGYMYGKNASTLYNANMTDNNYTNSNNAVYNEVNSHIKDVLDGWYEENILNTGYEKYIENDTFCNDRSLNTNSEEWDTFDTRRGYGNNFTYYGGYHRLNIFDNETKKILPSLKCLQENDNFNVDIEEDNEDKKNGNHKLIYPIGLITMDEVILAGGSYEKKNEYFYLYRGNNFWTMTPAYTANSGSYMYLGAGETVGMVTEVSSLVPVINLKKDAADTLLGSGTITFDTGGNVIENDAYYIEE